MARPLICSSHTISGVMPGGPTASRHSFEERARACAEAGYIGLCLHYRDYLEQRRAGLSDDRLRSILDDHGMTLRSVEFSADWFPDGDAAQRTEADIHAACAAYGATSFNIGGDLAGHGIAFETMRERFHALCRRAGARALSVAFEIVAWGNVTTVDAALALLDGAPANAGLVVDSWHIFRGGVALSELRRIPAGRILCVQINDAAAEPGGPLLQDTVRRRLCGEGSFDLRGFIAVLDSMGVAVPPSVEIISQDNAARDLAAVARETYRTAQAVLAA